jgi:CBS domain-containing protein
VTLHGNDDVRHAMRAPVVAVAPGTTLRAAAATLGRRDIGAVAVLDGDVLVGVLSERDVVRSLGDGRDPDVTLVGVAMSHPPRAVTADSPLWAATLLMLQLGVRHLPVTQSDRTVGMLSIRDALTVMERDRIIEPGSPMQTVHDRLGPSPRRQPATGGGVR